MPKKLEKPKKQVYPRVRALERGLELINALSELGWATPTELAQHTGIHRATVYRLLDTLVQNNYIHLRPSDSRYFLTKRISHVADSIRDDDWVAQIVSPHLGHLLYQIQWPSDFATFTAGHLTIKESTHRFSPMSINRRMVGKSRPLLSSALGLAFLSAVSDESREKILSLAKLAGDASVHMEGKENLIKAIQVARARGYSESSGGTQHNISAIAKPICWHNRVVGAINIMFFRQALTPTKAAELYLKQLEQCVYNIEQELKSIPLDSSTGWVKRRDL